MHPLGIAAYECDYLSRLAEVHHASSFMNSGFAYCLRSSITKANRAHKTANKHCKTRNDHRDRQSADKRGTLSRDKGSECANANHAASLACSVQGARRGTRSPLIGVG